VAQKLQPKKAEPENLLGPLALKYAIAIAVLLVVSYFLIISGLSIGIFYVFTLPTGLALVPHFFGRILEIRKHALSGHFVRDFITPSTFALFFFSSLGIALSGFLGSSFTYYALGFPAILLLANWLMLSNFGDSVIATGENVAQGIVAKRFSSALGIFLLYYLSSISPTYSWLRLTFLFPAIVYGALAFAPLFALQRKGSYGEDATYLMDSAAKFAVVAAGVGFVFSIFLLFPSVYFFVAIVVFAGVILAFAGYKFYSLGAMRINAVEQELYQKHYHKLNLTDDDNFAFVKGPIGEFIATGRKGNLIIAFTALLTNAGIEAGEIMQTLEFLSMYEIPAVFSYQGLNLRRALEQQVLFRIGVVNDTMRMMSKVVGERS
jgi:hypothetical protein